ncbi:hypothetical protein N7461_001037 [Penicillium sp. DV-2018c]|nr:hypothetical protein N7461_001037 [Penicillium sp. DV-2018c]
MYLYAVMILVGKAHPSRSFLHLSRLSPSVFFASPPLIILFPLFISSHLLLGFLIFKSSLMFTIILHESARNPYCCM